MSNLTILVPLDGSATAEAALSMLGALQPLGDIHVRVLSVAESEALSPADVEKLRQKLAAEYLDGVAVRFPHLGAGTEFIRRTGVPRDEIIDEATRPDVDLVLMTTHGQSSRDLTTLGSVADRVIRGVSKPVLLVNPAAPIPESIELIEVPLDGSVAATEAIPLAVELAVRTAATLRLIRVVARPVNNESDSTGNARGLATLLEATAQRYLDDIRDAVAGAAGVHTAVLSGHDAGTLLADFEQQRPDLVVMTAHGKRGFVPWALGSVTERLIAGARVPIVVVRRDPALAPGRTLAQAIGS